MQAVVELPIHIYQKGGGHKLGGKPAEGAAAGLFLDQVCKLALDLLSGSCICVEAVELAALGVIKTIGQIPVNLGQAAVAVSAEPEYKPAVRVFVGKKVRTVGGVRGDQETVPIFHGVALIADPILHIALQEKIKFIVVMGMGSDRLESRVAVVENLKILRAHILSGIKTGGQLFFQWSILLS